MYRNSAHAATAACLVFPRAHTLLLASAAELLLAILLLLPLLAPRLDGWGFFVSRPNEAVLGLVLLGSINTVVGESKAGALATTKACLHTKDDCGLGNSLVALSLRQVLRNHILQHLLVWGGEPRVVHIEDHLATLKQPVCQELTRTNGDRALCRHVAEAWDPH